MINHINNNMDYYCAYLRKSRKDRELEAQGQGETLARHEKMLKDLAEKRNIKISKFYREVVSGESIATRPVMQELLADVEKGLWTGVLVVEVERLARGDTMDQGLVSQTFKYSNTKIITPLKIYDPNNDFDEQYFEFGLFSASWKIGLSLLQWLKAISSIMCIPSSFAFLCSLSSWKKVPASWSISI